MILSHCSYVNGGCNVGQLLHHIGPDLDGLVGNFIQTVCGSEIIILMILVIPLLPLYHQVDICSLELNV